MKLIQARLAPKPGEIKTTPKTGATRQHPGDDPDSDDEDDKKKVRKAAKKGFFNGRAITAFTPISYVNPYLLDPDTDIGSAL